MGVYLALVLRDSLHQQVVGAWSVLLHPVEQGRWYMVWVDAAQMLHGSVGATGGEEFED